MQTRLPHDAPTLTQWRMVSMLCLVNAIAFIDRTALPLLVQPIKRDLEPARRSLATEQAVSLREEFASVRDRWAIFAPLFVAGGGQEALGLALSGAGGTLSMIGGLSLFVVSWQSRRREASLVHVAAA